MGSRGFKGGRCTLYGTVPTVWGGGHSVENRFTVDPPPRWLLSVPGRGMCTEM